MLSAFAGRPASARLPKRVHAFDEHQSADYAQKDDIAKPHQQIDLPDRFQRVEYLHPQRRADQTPDQQDDTHPQVHRSSPKVGEGTGKGRRDDLVRLGRHGHRRRNADEEQQWRHQKPTAHAEHARQNADHTAKSQ